MSQASQDISQQFINGGVVPAQLESQQAVSKIYVDNKNALQDAQISSAQASISSHIASPSAHAAQNITYSGKIAGVPNVKQALDSQNDRIDNIVASTGSSNTEVVDARQPSTGTVFSTLKTRLDNSDLQLSNNAKKVGFVHNVKEFGAVGNGIADDTAAFQSAINSLGVRGGNLFVPSGKYKLTDGLDIIHSISIYGEGWSMTDGTTILAFNMDGKPLSKPAIKIHKTECVNLEGIYVLNEGLEKRDGVSVDGGNGGANNEMNSFVSCVKVISNKFKNNFFVAHTWIVSFRDCYAGYGDFGWYCAGGTITTLLLDHCYTASQSSRGYYINGAHYTTFISCATDYAPIGYKFSNAENVVMIGCACESAVNTAIDIDGSTVVIEGFVSVGNGTGSGADFATIINAVSSRISARGFSEVILPSPNTKIASVSLANDVTGEYVSTGKELLGIYYPKNGRFLYNGQAFTTGAPTGTGWLSSDIGKTIHESAPVQAGTTPNKYVIFGYVRLTAGNGNAIGVDWFPLRASTGL